MGRFLSVMAVALVTLLGLATAALAHEHRTVGEYDFVVGFINEPAISGELNGLSLRVSEPAAADAAATPGATPAAAPVEGLESTLKAEVIYGDQKMELTLQPAFRQPGLYQAYFIPMKAGDYSFHITGTINGQAVDETFTSSPDGFDSVQDRSALEFPKP